jgi:hypothetical protein
MGDCLRCLRALEHLLVDTWACNPDQLGSEYELISS